MVQRSGHSLHLSSLLSLPRLISLSPPFCGLLSGPFIPFGFSFTVHNAEERVLSHCTNLVHSADACQMSASTDVSSILHTWFQIQKVHMWEFSCFPLESSCESCSFLEHGFFLVSQWSFVGTASCTELGVAVASAPALVLPSGAHF